MQNTLVIGGSGFLGAALANALLARGLAVRSLDLTPHPNPQIESCVGDLRDPAVLQAACTGVDTVFQTAALVDWGPRSRERLESINVAGNRAVLRACQQEGIRRLVYTSSIDVVFSGAPLANGDESLPYPARHLDDYGRTKMLAEQDALAANGIGRLMTCALRTAGIYGPGDRHRFPAILSAVRRGQMLRLGDGSAKFGHVYVGNVVQAHIQAAQALSDPAALPAGQAYFIGDHPPGNFYDFFTPYLQALGYPPPQRTLPESLAYTLAVILESLARLGLGPTPPLLTRYVVASTCRDFYFSYAKAARDFGYVPAISAEQAQAETLAWLRRSGWSRQESQF